MIPIEKNIHVVDDQNNQYESTYLKRAKGLVKKGRAYFVDETTICLTSPLLNKTEELNMSENIESIEAHQGCLNSKTNAKYSIDYILEQIEKIAAQTEYLTRAFDALITIKDEFIGEHITMPPLTGQAQAQAIGDAVKSRESTNQQILKLYEKMYEELRPK